MKIRNTHELRLRVKWHLEQGHLNPADGAGHGFLRQSTGEIHGYGADAIGLMATPHRKRGIGRWIRRCFGADHAIDDRGGSRRRMLRIDPREKQIERLGKEFGITPRLATLIDSLACLDLRSPEAALAEFVDTLPEGIDLRPRDVDHVLRGGCSRPDLIAYLRSRA